MSPFLKFKSWLSRLKSVPRLPVILQSEKAECGLACIAMVACYYGHHTDMLAMRRDFSLSNRGMTLSTMMQVASKLSLAARTLKVPLDKLQHVTMPCILHWDMQHFVVLKSLEQTSAVIHDPATGSRRMPLSEISDRFSGIALELVPSQDFERRDEAVKFSMLAILGPVTGVRTGLVHVFVLGLSLQALLLLTPFYLQWTVDRVLKDGNVELLPVLGAAFLLVAVMQTVAGTARSLTVANLSMSVNFQWLQNAFGHLLRLPLGYFEKRHLGDVLSRFSSIEAIQRTLTSASIETVIDGLFMLIALVVMFLYSVPLALVSLAAVTAYAVWRYVTFAPLREANAEQIVHEAVQRTHLLEAAQGVQSVKLFNRATEVRSVWTNRLIDQFNSGMRAIKLTIAQQAGSGLIFNLERVVTIWLGATLAMSASLSIGSVLAFIAYRDQFIQRLSALIDKVFEIRMLAVHRSRVADILMTPPEAAASGTTVVDADAVSIECRGLYFRYASHEPFVIDGISLQIEQGECVAITGPSGCGKTTLVKLLLGLFDPTKGEVLVAGVPMRDFGALSFRDIVGAVMQEDHLFSGSIADNISFYDPGPDQARIEAASRAANIHDEINRMTMGYHTIVGAVGAGLSGGQKQRILLARALYRQPKILVLDEATSHLDVPNERLVNGAVGRMKLTRIIVAHRPETIAMADRVLRIEKGRLVPVAPGHFADRTQLGFDIERTSPTT